VAGGPAGPGTASLPSARAPVPAMRELLRERRFRLLFAGQVTSMTGDSLLLVVLAIWMKDLTGSSSQAGAVMLAIAAPALLSPVLGWLVDRVRRRPFVVWVNAGSAVALLPLLTVHDSSRAWVIYLVAVAYGLSFNLNSAGMAGMLKHLVAEDRLSEANGALAAVRESLRLGGPLAGAGLYAVCGAWPVVTLDVVSFVLCAVATLAIGLREEKPRPGAGHWREEAAGGFRHLFGDAGLRDTTIALATALLVFGTMEAAVFAYVDHGLHRPAAFVGAVSSSMGVGSVIGALLAPLVIRRLGEPGTVSVGLTAMAAGLVPLLFPGTLLGLVAVPLVGLGVSFGVVAFSTLLQRRTPQELLGRVSTATDLLVGAPQTLSIAVGAVLVAWVDYRWIFAAAAAGLLAAAAGLRWASGVAGARAAEAGVLSR